MSAASSACSMAESAKSDRSLVASTKPNSPQRSPSATVSATPARRRRSSPSTVSPVAASAWPTAAAAAVFDEGRHKLRKAGGRSLSGMASIPAPGEARRPERPVDSVELASVRRASATSRETSRPVGRSTIGPWIRSVDPMVRRISTWTVESSASIFRQHMPASRPHSGEPSRRRTKSRANSDFSELLRRLN